jgi:hypothetical protein
MTIDRMYRCDLCGASVPKELLDQVLYGIYWVDFPVHGWEKRPARECEHHICHTCLISLKAWTLEAVQ